MNVTSFALYRHRNKPQAYRVGFQAQQRRKAHITTATPARDMTKWRRRLEAEVQRQKTSNY